MPVARSGFEQVVFQMVAWAQRAPEYPDSHATTTMPHLAHQQGFLTPQVDDPMQRAALIRERQTWKVKAPNQVATADMMIQPMQGKVVTTTWKTRELYLATMETLEGLVM
jgi:hypothetical protein